MMLSRRSKLSRFLMFLSLFLLVHITVVQQIAQALTFPGYRGTSLAGRVSWVTLDCPGGFKVNTFLGNLIYPRHDLYLAGRGLPIEITLTFNANNANSDTGFGNGWSFGYLISVFRKADDSIVITWGDGRKDLYAFSGGVYTPLNEGVFATLQQIAGSQLLLTTHEHLQYLFDLPAQNASSSVKQIQDPDGNALTFAYDVSGRLTTITDASSRNIFLNYTLNHVTSITDPNTSPARVVQYTYDAAGNQVQYTDAVGTVTLYAYDSVHRLKRITDPLGTTSMAHTGPNGSVSSIIRKSPTNVLLSYRSFSYDTLNRTTTVTDRIDASNNAVTRYVYDTNKRLSQITDPLSHTQTFTYDAAGNLATVTDANGHSAHYTYDGQGNMLTATDALNHTTTYTYEPTFNRVQTVTDPRGNTTSYDYDAQGHRTKMTDALGNDTLYDYDSAGQVISRTDGRGFTTTYDYNAQGRIIQQIEAGATTTHTYDGAGRMTSAIDPRGLTTQYDYDARDRIIDILYDGGSHEIRTYDANNNLKTVTDPDTNRSFFYDGNSRLLQDVDNLRGKTTTSVYDGLGRRMQMTDPEGTVTRMTYDKASRPLTILRNAETFRFFYDNAGRRTSSILPNGGVTSYAYDAADRMTLMTNRRSNSTVISSFAYQYDAANNRTQTTLSGGDNIISTYDGANRMVEEQRTGTANYDHKFSYDAVGNRVQENADGVITTSVYDTANRLTQSTTGAATTTYDYDNSGNLIKKTDPVGVTHYDYDNRNRQTVFNSPTHIATYSYDAFNQQTAKTVDGITTRYGYDGRRVITEYDGGGSLQAQYLYDPDINRPLSRYTGVLRYDYTYDALSSVRQVLDSAQTVRNAYDYDGNGVILSQSETVTNDYTYNARRLDRESALYDYQDRRYDSATGGFTQADRYDDNRGLSRYVYADNNPVTQAPPPNQSSIFVSKYVQTIITFIRKFLEWLKPNSPGTLLPPQLIAPLPSYWDQEVAPLDVEASNGSNGKDSSGGDGTYGEGTSGGRI